MTQKITAALLATTLLGGCSMAPAYHVPAQLTPLPANFKAEPGWAQAAPADTAPKGDWWKLFGDPTLDALEAKVAVTNQNVAQARAAWLQARAVVAVDRAAQLPTAGISAGASHARAQGATGPAVGNSFNVGASASWAVDLWGKLAGTTAQAKANAEASAGDLANATLSAQAALAEDYLSLRATDAEKALLDATVAADAQALKVVRNQYAVGVVSRSVVDAATSTLDTATASDQDLARQRAAYENAVAVLVGENPSTFAIAPAAWTPTVPDVPGVVPGDILQRRPDIASAERQVAAANANIGIQRAAFFPQLSLSASAGSTAGSLGQVLSAATSVWSLGGNLAETLLDWGARSAQVRGAREAYNGAVAGYRQTVLTAFQQVEDNLAASNAYAAQGPNLAEAAKADARNAEIARNQLAAGTIDYTSVATAIAAANNSRTSQIANVVNRQTAAVALIEAIGGTWQGRLALDPPARGDAN